MGQIYLRVLALYKHSVMATYIFSSGNDKLTTSSTREGCLDIPRNSETDNSSRNAYKTMISGQHIFK